MGKEVKATVNSNIARIKVDTPESNSSFFLYWLDFLRPFHKLTSVETKVLAGLLRERHLLSKVITDEKLLDRVVLGKDTRKKLVDSCAISANNLSVTLASLKTKGIIVDSRINKRYIPNLSQGSKQYEMILSFSINE